MKTHTYKLRGYTRRVNGRFVAVCLAPHLVTEGASHAEASLKMHQLVRAYVADAFEDNQLDMFMAKRAPLRTYVEYALAGVL